MIGVELILFSFFIIIYFSSTKKLQQRRNWPPGPWSWPIIGNVEWFFAHYPGRTLFNFGKKYGPIALMKLGASRVVLINDIQLWKESFRRSNLCGRPGGVYKSVFKNRGIVFADAGHELKLYMMKTLKTFVETDFEPVMHLEAQNLLRKIRTNLTKPFNMENNGILCMPIVNVIWYFLFGNIPEETQHDFQLIVDSLQALSTDSNFFGRKAFLNMIPFISKVFPSLSRSKFTRKTLNELINVVKNEIQVQRNTRRHTEVRNLADIFHDKMIENIENKYTYFGQGDLQHLFFTELIFASIDSTSTLLNWMTLFLATHENIQRKFQAEIDQVLGTNSPSLADQDKMVYTLAILQETLRLSCIENFQVHRATENTKIMGYDIPENCLILPNAFKVSWDPDIWENPEEFRPERFIEDGRLINSEKIFAFGTGKRTCLGEMLARKEVFILVVSIFQAFDVKVDGKVPGIDGRFGIFYSPLPYKLKFIPRKFD